MKRLLGNGLWWASCLPETARFLAAARSVERTQEQLLAAMLRRNAPSLYGRIHRFTALRSVRDYQEAVPLTTYEDYLPYIERIGEGEAQILTREPVRLLEPTSGSRTPSKLIPYTAELKRQFQRAVAPWVAALFAYDPALFPTSSYWTVTPLHDPGRRTRGGLPIGFEDDAEYLGPVARRLVEWTQAVPARVRHLIDPEAFYRKTLEHLLACPDLGLISAWSPSFLLLLMDPLPPGLPWPRLRWISCWCDGPSERYLPALRARFPGVRLQPKGLISTEGIVSFPWPWTRGLPPGGYPLAGAGRGGWGHPLALRSHFLEFLPAEGGRPHLAHELEIGRRYEVVLTTGGGLYRYRLGDVVQVCSRLHECPTVRFCGRLGGVCDRFGEKLHPDHVGAALARWLPQADFAMIAFAGDAYVLFVQAAGLTEEELCERTARLEQELRQNFHYDHCRRLGQLPPLGCFAIRTGGLEDYCREQVARGQRLGDIKPQVLDPSPGWERVFQGRRLVRPPCSDGPS